MYINKLFTKFSLQRACCISYIAHILYKIKVKMLYMLYYNKYSIFELIYVNIC